MTPVRFYILSRISFLELRRLNSISRCFLGEKLKISLQLVAAKRVKKNSHIVNYSTSNFHLLLFELLSKTIKLGSDKFKLGSKVC